MRPAASIAVAEQVALRSSGDTADLTLNTDVVQSGSGWYVAGPVGSQRGALGLYDSAGVLTKLFGGDGRGPGEIPSTQGRPDINGLAFGPADTLYVVSRGLLHLFSPPPAMAFVRATPLTRFGSFQATPLGFTSYPIKVSSTIAPGVKSSTGLIARPPVAYDWSGHERIRFGEVRGDAADDDVFGPISFADSTHLWFGAQRRYEIRLLGPDGRTVRTLRRSVDWFPSDSSVNDWPWVKRPLPRISSMYSPDNTTLWVLIRRAHRDWKPMAIPAPRLDRPIPVGLIPHPPLAAVYETVLEVLDGRDGRLIASLDLGGDVRGFNSAGLLVQHEEDESGLATVRLWRPLLTRR